MEIDITGQLQKGLNSGREVIGTEKECEGETKRKKQ